MDDTQKTKAGFEDTLYAVRDDVVDILDGAVDRTAEFIGGKDGNKIIGGAAVGALAAIVLPISLLGGALLGAGYAVYRKANR